MSSARSLWRTTTDTPKSKSAVEERIERSQQDVFLCNEVSASCLGLDLKMRDSLQPTYASPHLTHLCTHLHTFQTSKHLNTPQHTSKRLIRRKPTHILSQRRSRSQTSQHDHRENGRIRELHLNSNTQYNSSIILSNAITMR